MEGTRGIPEQWWASGKIFKDRMVCQYQKTGFSSGIWYGDSPLDSPTSLILFQMFLIFIFTRAIHCLFHPLRQSMIVAQIVAGLVLGPSCLTHDQVLAHKLFPPPARYILKTISSFGFMLHLFIMGVKIDVTAIRSSGAKSIVIGISGLIFPLVLGSFAFYVVRQLTEVDPSLYTGIRVLISFNSLSFFMVTSGFLHDLKLSNSEVGRLACSSSLVVDLLGLFGTTVSFTWFGVDTASIPSRMACFLSISFYYAVLFCIFRPLVLCIVRRTPEGATTLKQSQIMLVLVILMVAWYWGEALGQRFATFLFGLSLPDGPPLGSALAQRLELFTSSVLLPVFCTMAGWRINLSSWKGDSQAGCVELIFVIGILGKFLGTLFASTAVGVPFQDAVPLGLMMSLKGIMEVAVIGTWGDQAVLDDRLFSLSMMNILLFTGVAYPLTKLLYDPSSTYNILRKRSVMGIGENGHLPVLVCIHDEESVPAIVNLVELIKLKNGSGSISLFTVQLIHLAGSSMPVLVPLYKYKKSAANFSHFEHAEKALDQFEIESQGQARVQHFVSVTPYKSMHNDICSLAHDKRTTLIITPFHKKWGIDGKVETSSPQIKEVNRRVLRKSPCSVAILIDKNGSTAAGALCVLPRSESHYFKIAMVFIGGSDDHEALALARRMAEHPNVRLTVIWLKSNEYQPQLQDAQEDTRVMLEFTMKAKKNNKIAITEQYVTDGLGTTKAMLSMQHADLFIVGKYHEPECPAIQGLIVWDESSEIGELADMLATSDFQFSILVVQQQPRVVDWTINCSRQRTTGDLSLSFNDSHKSFR